MEVWNIRFRASDGNNVKIELDTRAGSPGSSIGWAVSVEALAAVGDSKPVASGSSVES